MLVGSGSIRKPALGPVVRLGDLKVIFPFEDEIMGIVWTGAQLRRAMQFVLRDEMFSDETEFYQVSKTLKLTYDAQTKQFTEFTMYGKPVADDAKFRIGLQIFHYSNMEDFSASVWRKPAPMRSRACWQVQITPSWRSTSCCTIT